MLVPFFLFLHCLKVDSGNQSTKGKRNELYTARIRGDEIKLELALVSSNSEWVPSSAFVVCAHNTTAFCPTANRQAMEGSRRTEQRRPQQWMRQCSNHCPTRNLCTPQFFAAPVTKWIPFPARQK